MYTMNEDFYRRINVLFVLLFWGSATVLYSQNPTADSLKRLLAREQVSGKIFSDTSIIRLMNEIAYTVRNTEHDTALVYANEALLRAKHIGDKKGEARAKMVIGIVAIYEGHYNAGLDAHIEAIELYRALGDKVQEAFLLNNIGYLYKAQGRLPIAKDYFLRSLEMFRASGFDDGISLVLGNLGDIALKRSEFQDALNLVTDALQYAYRSSDPFYANIALFHLGTIHYAMNNLDSALVYQTAALKRFEKEGSGQYVVRSLENIAAIYASKKQFVKAFDVAYRGLHIADSLKVLTDMALIYERLSILAAETGKHAQALEFYRLTASLRDSLTSLNIAERMKTLDMMRTAEKNAKELALAEKEQSELSTMRNYLLAGMSFALVLLALGIHRYRFIARSEAALREINSIMIKQQALLEEQSKHIQEANTALESSNSELDAKNERLTETNSRLEQANERLAALNYEKDELLGIVAHDLKNPLTTIMMASSSLTSKDLSQERVIVLGERMLHSSERMLNIITKLLNVNALEQGAKTLHVQTIDICETVRFIVEEHLVHAHAKEIIVDLSCAPEKLELRTDESIVAEIVENLLDNALKYSPRGKRVWVSVQAENGESEHVSSQNIMPQALSICVRDEGPGFSEEDKEKVFGKFVRLSAKPTGGEESTGLGLSIVKKLVQMLDGTIYLESVKGHGAAFTVQIPSLE